MITNIAFKCMECGLINIFPKKHGDGNRCKCGGNLIPIGYAVVSKDCDSTINIGVDVDTTELDKALNKARELSSIIDGLKGRR